MQEGKKMVAVVVPIYKPVLGRFEEVSLWRTCEVLGRYPIVVVHPQGMDTGALSARFPQLLFRPFAPAFFQGIMGYNRLMLSETFYRAFLDFEYILICQLDAYIFRDELEEWCSRGFDYVGAPWLRRRVYDLPLVKQWMQLKKAWAHGRGRRSKQDLYGRVGNGGLSLRRVKSHCDALRDCDRLPLYTDRERKEHLYNEDVFWAMEPQSFRYPSVEEALLFAFDKYPSLCFRLTGGKLPFGCHAWHKRRMRDFWAAQGLPV